MTENKGNAYRMKQVWTAFFVIIALAVAIALYWGADTSAVVAVGALLALSRSETIYFIAGQDDDGETLRGNCRYVVTGRDVPARWWSVTAYAGDHFLIPNAENRWSYSDRSVTRDADGGFRLTLSRDRAEGDWLPTGQAERLVLLLRLYNPGPAVAADPGAAVLPSIRKEGCS